MVFIYANHIPPFSKMLMTGGWCFGLFENHSAINLEVSTAINPSFYTGWCPLKPRVKTIVYYLPQTIEFSHLQEKLNAVVYGRPVLYHFLIEINDRLGFTRLFIDDLPFANDNTETCCRRQIIYKSERTKSAILSKQWLLKPG